MMMNRRHFKESFSACFLKIRHLDHDGEDFHPVDQRHNHFELGGWSETRVVAVFSIVTAILCLVGILAL